MNITVQKMQVSGSSFVTVGDPESFTTPSGAAALGTRVKELANSEDASFNQVWVKDADTGSILMRVSAPA